MLLDQDPRSQRLRRVLVVDGHRGLPDDRAGVEIGRDNVNSRATDLDAMRPRLALSFEAWERREQRRMHIQDGVRECFDKLRTEEAHEACQAHEADIASTQLAHEGAIVIGSQRVSTMIEVARLDPGSTRPLQPRRIRSIRDDDRDGGIQAPFGNGIYNRLKVASAPGNQDT